MTLEWKVRSYRSENGRKIMSEDRRSLENKDFLQISQLVLHSKDPRFYYLGFSFVFCWTSPTFTVFISAVAVQPALFFRQNGQQRTTPELLGSGVVFRLDPYLTHTVFPWVWVKLWSGYRRIPAPGIFLTAPSAPAPHPFSWLPPAGPWW